MSWKNTKDRYGKLAMILHWSVALLFLLLYASVYYRRWFTEGGTTINLNAIQLHFSLGVTAMVFVFLRVVYKLWDKSPNPPPGTKLEHLLAKSAHFLLYMVMIIMPLTGYFGTGANTDFFFLFEIPKFKETYLYDLLVTNWLGLSWQEFEKPIDFIHKKGGAYLVWVLIAIHVGAALYHHFIRRNNVLLRILPVKKLRNETEA